MRVYMLVVSLVAVACSQGGNNKGVDDTADATTGEAPLVWIDTGGGLPSGESSKDSLDVTVSGNKTATTYAYSLFSDTSVTCAAADYGVFKNISVNLTELNLGDNGDKVICIKGKDALDQEQAEPNRYTWTKVDGPAEEGQAPEATLETGPSDGPLEQISSNVNAVTDVTVKYQYALVNMKDYDCAGIDADTNVSYSTAVAISNTLVQNIGADGPKTLCLRGLDKDDQLQDPATRYTWEKTAPVPSGADEKSAAGAVEGRISLFGSSFHLRSGNATGTAIMVYNAGKGMLKWEANTASAVPWLEVKVGANYQALTAGKLAEGELAAGKSAQVELRLAKGRGTDYGAPYKRTHEIVFTNKDSGHEIKTKIVLEIPKLEVPAQAVRLTLSRDSAPIKVYAKDLNKSLGMSPIEIDIAPGFPTDITSDEKKARYDKFTSLVTVGRPKLESTGANSGKKYIEFTVTAAGKQSCETMRQTLFIYSNGDSKGASNCNIKAQKKYIGTSSNAKWTTSRCLRIVATFNAFDLNNDNKIDILDLTTIAKEVGKPRPAPMTAAYSRADVDGNGKVEQADMDLLSKCFGTKY